MIERVVLSRLLCIETNLTEWAILFVMAFVAATVSGAAGFGGALLLLPFLTGMVGVKAAVPILTLGQLFGNASRVWFGRRELHWRPVLLFLLTAVPLSVAGSWLFTGADARVVKIGIGIFLLLLVVYRRSGMGQFSMGDGGMMLGGALTGFLSGLAGSAGPLGAAFFLGLNLPATAYIASEAFSALIMHLTKTVVYSRFSLMGSTELLYGLFIGVAMVLGSWAGKGIAERLSRERFILLVEVLLVLSGVQMVWAAW